MKRLGVLAALAALTLAAPAMAGQGSADGIWRNPRGTIDVRIQPCGEQLCGVIARASPEAMQDAKDAGIANLIGIELLKDYRKTGPTRWDGTVYVPDMGHSFSSHIEQISPTELKISGCLIGGWLCKSQLWTRR
jgi:uncharacterized protein (DUF2147 family)